MSNAKLDRWQTNSEFLEIDMNVAFVCVLVWIWMKTKWTKKGSAINQDDCSWNHNSFTIIDESGKTVLLLFQTNWLPQRESKC